MVKKNDQPSEKDEKLSEDSKKPKKLDITKLKELMSESSTYMSNHKDKWADYYKSYKGERILRTYDGQSDVIVREAHTIIETIVSNIASGLPEFKFVPTTVEQSKETDVLNNYVKWVLLQNRFAIKQQSWVRDMALYGNGFLHVGVGDDKGTPKIENIPARDIIIDPNSTDITNAQYMGHSYFADIATLESATIYDPEKDAYVKRYKKLNSVKENAKKKSEGKDKLDKEFKDQFNGSTLGDEAIKRQVRVSRIYHLPTGMMYEIANGETVIYEGAIPFQRKESEVKIQRPDADGNMVESIKKLEEIKPFLPYAPARNLIDASQFLAEGDMAIIMNDSELLSDIASMDMDNAMLINTPMWQIDPAFADLAPEIESISGSVYPIPKGALTPLDRPNIGPDLAMKMNMTENRMRRSTAADDAVQGVAQAKSRTTATEISSQLVKAQDRFGVKITNLESEGFAQLGQIIMKILQIFVTQETIIKVVGPMGVEFKNYDPYEYDGEFEVNVLLDSTLKRQQMEVGQKNNQLFQLFSDDPQGLFNPIEVKRWMAKTVDPSMTDDKFNAMLAPPAPSNDDMPAKEYINIDYKDASPHVKAQIEKKLGFEPDPAHIGDSQVKMLQQANQMADMENPLTDANNKPLPMPPMQPTQGGMNENQ